VRFLNPGWLVLAAILLVPLQGCESAAKLDDYLDKTIAGPAKNSRIRNSQNHAGFQPSGHDPRSDMISGSAPLGQRPKEIKGTGKFLAQGEPYRAEKTAKGGEGITLNLVNVPVAQAAKTIFSDILKLNYTISEQVAGSITIQTSTPMEREALVDAFESILRANGASIAKSGETYNIVPSANLPAIGRELVASNASRGLGTEAQIISLNNVSASEMKRIIEPVVPQGSVLRADTSRNLLIVNGTRREISNINSLVQLFDVDWMKGMSVGFYPVRTSDPEVIANELSTVMGLDKDGPLRGVVRIMPNRRLGSVLVMSSKPQHLDTAKKWIEKIEQSAERSEPQLFVYRVQNRPTLELASVLQRLLGSGSSGSGETAAPIAPKYEATTASTSPLAGPIGAPLTKGLASSGPMASPGAAQSQPASAEAELAEPENHSDVSPGRQTPSRFANTKVTADEAKHALLIEALPRDYDRILRILERIDTISTQIMLEAVIAEVSLNDELKFGVKWYFEAHPSGFTFSDAAAGAVNSAFPGFSYFFSTSSMKMALDALSGITDVKVVSAPSLMAMDNRKAVLQIGDQVPIITQSAQSVINPDSPIVNSVTMKDTGIILAVTPRVNDSGSVVLEIEQEVSSVAKTTSSGIDSPTIQQRRIQTTVVVGDGEVVALGGLIQQRDEVNKTQIPMLGNIPFLGAAFRKTSDEVKRTELVIFIRPQVSRDQNDARQITEEYRSRINLQPMMETKGRDHYHRDANRILR
jgi:general secretion pathway protein D